MTKKGTTMRVSDFYAAQEPWFDLDKFYHYLLDNDFEITKLPCDNRSDGEVHWLLTKADHARGWRFELHANYWDRSHDGWAQVVEFVAMAA